MKERILTAIVLLAVVVGVLFFDPTGVGAIAILTLAGTIVAFELGSLLSLPVPLIVVMTLMCVFTWWKAHSDTTRIAIYLACSLTLAYGWNRTKSEFLAFAFGAVFVGATISGLLGIATMRNHFPVILTAAIPIWAGDTAAIFAGRAFGKHKLAPSISPNKTWEGSIANLLAAVGAAAALGYFLKYPMDKMLLLGVSCGVIGQLGDLFESYLKRQAGVKDSGSLLPGHGGVFDRLDSLLMTAPFSYWILSSFLK